MRRGWREIVQSELEYISTCYCWYADCPSKTSYREVLRTVRTQPKGKTHIDDKMHVTLVNQAFDLYCDLHLTSFALAYKIGAIW